MPVTRAILATAVKEFHTDVVAARDGWLVIEALKHLL
jgi:hypothetical protein